MEEGRYGGLPPLFSHELAHAKNAKCVCTRAPCPMAPVVRMINAILCDLHSIGSQIPSRGDGAQLPVAPTMQRRSGHYTPNLERGEPLL